MTRRGIISLALFAKVSTLVAVLAAPAITGAQEYRPWGASRSANSESKMKVRRTAPSAPRAGSIDLERQVPAYQRAVFEPPPKMPDARSAETAKYRRASMPSSRTYSETAFEDAAADGEYFDPPKEQPRGRRRASINRAAYQDPSATEGAPAAPEDLPMPGDADPMPGDVTMPMGAMPGHMEPYGDGPMFANAGCASGNCGDCGTCGDVCDPCDTCVDWYPGKDLTLFAGVHGFKSAVDNGQNGNFGFQEGVNWSSPFWNAAGIGFQAGFQAMQSDFHPTAFFTEDRSQYFLTTGFFRRQMCGQGWQWGVVYDHLFDEFVEDYEVGQIRGELSYLFRGHELGYWFATGASDDVPGADSTTGISSYEAVDMHAFFYRRRLMNGGEGRLWGGFTKESDTIFGGDLRVPLACDWDVVAAFNYLAPQDDATTDGPFPEAWNIGINLVWYVCPQGAMQAGGSRYRPLFNVADNGTLIVNTVR
jgi:hypothetical protein